MKFSYFIFFISFCLLSSCGSKATVSSEGESALSDSEAMAAINTTPSDTARDVNTEKTSAVGEEQALQARSAAVGNGFPMDQRVAFTSEMLNGLCTSKYSCLEQVIYPLGWSEDGKFAYFIEEANEAVYNYTLHFIIQDTETDKQLVKETFKASEQPKYEPDDTAIDFESVWPSRKDRYNQLLSEHNIRAGNGTQFYGMPWVVSQRPYRFKAINKMAHSDLFDLDFVSEHRLEASEQGGGKKIILKHTFGKYDLALATQALGYFQSPFEDRVAVVDAYEKRGYEGPPNVLKLMVVGCDLTQWGN